MSTTAPTAPPYTWQALLLVLGGFLLVACTLQLIDHGIVQDAFVHSDGRIIFHSVFNPSTQQATDLTFLRPDNPMVNPC